MYLGCKSTQVWYCNGWGTGLAGITRLKAQPPGNGVEHKIRTRGNQSPFRQIFVTSLERHGSCYAVTRMVPYNFNSGRLGGKRELVYRFALLK